MNSINLMTHVRCHKSTDEKTFARYAKVECGNNQKVTKSWEEDDLESFCALFGKRDYQFFSHFFYNFKIEQISKEFDLLRIGKDYILNIELKHESTKEKVIRQLLGNRYYLSVLDTPIHSFTYIAQTNTLYYLCEDELEEADVNVLARLINDQRIRKVRDLNQLFTPELFLVSPFQSPDKFLKDEYFLTDQQRMIKSEILHDLDQKSEIIFAISGSYGTGKTLLVYDLAKELMPKMRVGIIHCGPEKAGISTLKKNGYHIIRSEDIYTVSPDDYDILFVDNGQWLSDTKWQYLLTVLLPAVRYLVMTSDSKETAGIFEKQEFNYEIRSFALTHTIRRNKIMTDFLSALLHHQHNHSSSYKHIHVTSVSSDSEANEMIHYLTAQQQYYHVHLYFPSDEEYVYYERHVIVNGDINTKAFNKVVLCLDDGFYYDDEGRLQHPNLLTLRLLKQTIERTHFSLYLIVIRNNPLFKACLDILGESDE